MTTFLTQEQVIQNVPSILTKSGHESRSSRYAPISTLDVLKGLQDLGFSVTHAKESRVRCENKIGFNRHLLRLRRHNETEINGMFPELVLINSHDGSSSYQLRAGLYRMVCTNGMVVGDEMLCKRVRHQGDVVSKVVEACSDVIDVFPEVIETAQNWSNITLGEKEMKVYANSAKTLKWDTDSTVDVQPEEILRTRRLADKNTDLWTTFNVVQENLIKGGIVTRNKETRQRRRSKAVNSPQENTKLNTALWTLTEAMANLTK